MQVRAVIATEDFQTKMAIHVSSINVKGKDASSSSSSSSSSASLPSIASHIGDYFPSFFSSSVKDGGTPHRDAESSSSACQNNHHNQYNPDHLKTDLSTGKENNGNSKAGGEVEGKGKGDGESEEDVYKKAMRPLQYDETSELSKYHYR